MYVDWLKSIGHAQGDKPRGHAEVELSKGRAR